MPLFFDKRTSIVIRKRRILLVVPCIDQSTVIKAKIITSEAPTVTGSQVGVFIAVLLNRAPIKVILS
jgi:hypothetical protein